MAALLARCTRPELRHTVDPAQVSSVEPRGDLLVALAATDVTVLTKRALVAAFDKAFPGFASTMCREVDRRWALAACDSNLAFGMLSCLSAGRACEMVASSGLGGIATSAVILDALVTAVAQAAALGAEINLRRYEARLFPRRLDESLCTSLAAAARCFPDLGELQGQVALLAKHLGTPIFNTAMRISVRLVNMLALPWQPALSLAACPAVTRPEILALWARVAARRGDRLPAVEIEAMIDTLHRLQQHSSDDDDADTLSNFVSEAMVVVLSQNGEYFIDCPPEHVAVISQLARDTVIERLRTGEGQCQNCGDAYCCSICTRSLTLQTNMWEALYRTVALRRRSLYSILPDVLVDACTLPLTDSLKNALVGAVGERDVVWARGKALGQPVCGSGPEDPISMDVIEHPLTLRDADATWLVERETITRHLRFSQTNPFTRTALSLPDIGVVSNS